MAWSLCKIQHTAYDQNIINFSTDYKAVLRADNMEEVEGPMLKYGVQSMNGQKLQLPRIHELKPDCDFLAERYEAFLQA